MSSESKCSFCGHIKEKCREIQCPHPSWKDVNSGTKSVERKSKLTTPSDGEASD
jgi:hypothetical protein